MIFIYNKSLNPFYNMAAEEYLVKNSNDEIFMLWQNDNTIVIGRNQNTLSEINYDYVKENNINVVRRMSGGGAVFHDMGNINFTFILNSEDDFSNYGKFTSPIIEFLKTLGIDASLSGRNDLLIDGKKFSGNAQYMHKGRIMHHGTLLYSSQSDKIVSSLKVSEDKIKSKGIKSVKSRVTNIIDHLDIPLSATEFIEKLSEYMLQNGNISSIYDLENDREQIEKLRDEKYATWDWNFGYSPKYSFSKKERFPSGGIEVCMDVKTNGIIENVKIFGDFFSKNEISDLEKLLCGKKHEYHELERSLSQVNVSDYISGVTAEELLKILF